MVSGEASRLGLKRNYYIWDPIPELGGQWRGFPPGIETMVPSMLIRLEHEWSVERLPAWD